MKQFTPLTTFLLGLMLGAGLYHSYRHRQDEEDAAYFESLSSSTGWDGEDPLPAKLFRPTTVNVAGEVQVSPCSAKDRLDRDILIIEGAGKTPQQIADEIKQRVSELVREQRQTAVPTTPEPGDKN